MDWIQTDFQIPINYKERKLWFYDGESVFTGYVPTHFYPDKILEYLHQYNISHWMPYFPTPPSKK